MSTQVHDPDVSGTQDLPCDSCPVETACRMPDHLVALADLGPHHPLDHQSVQRGHLLMRNSEDSHDLWIIVTGLAVIQYVLPDGRRQILDFRFPGEILCPGLTGQHSELSAQTVCDTKLCHINGRDLTEIAVHRPKLVEELFDIACAQIKRANLQMLLLGRLSVAERMATFVLEMTERIGRPRRNGVEIELPMNRDDIADYLGLNPETVSRSLTRLKKSGAIGLPQPGRVVLRDVDALQEITPFPEGHRPFAEKSGIHQAMVRPRGSVCPIHGHQND